MRTVTAACLLLLVADGTAHGDEPAALVTDRPDQTESSVVVPKGTVQLEIGWLHTEDKAGGLDRRATELPGTLVRIGFAERWELRLGWAGQIDAELTGPGGAAAKTEGEGDGQLGAKVYLLGEKGHRPEVALLVASSLPVGERELTSDAFDPSFRFAFSHTLSDRVGLGYNVGMTWATEEIGGDDSRLSDFLYSVVLGFSLTPRLGAFTELFGELEGSSDAGARHSFDAGFTYRLGERLQLDLAAGTGLSDAASDWFVGTGLSVRWPR